MGVADEVYSQYCKLYSTADFLGDDFTLHEPHICHMQLIISVKNHSMQNLKSTTQTINYRASSLGACSEVGREYVRTKTEVRRSNMSVYSSLDTYISKQDRTLHSKDDFQRDYL